MLFCRHDIAVKATNCDVVPISAAAELIGSSVKSGVVTAASPKPEIVPAVVAPKGTKTMSSGVLPVRYLPTSAAINAAATALTGCPVENEGLPAA